jgi:uncharacterized membrane protein (UPF0127 family)
MNFMILQFPLSLCRILIIFSLGCQGEFWASLVLGLKDRFEFSTILRGKGQRSLVKNFFVLFLPIFLSLSLAGGKAHSEGGKKPFVQLIIEGKKIRVEVTQTEEEKARGLMFRESLGIDEGMLFVYPGEEILTFWMKNTPLPLSIAFLDQRGKIVDIQDMDPFSLRAHASALPAKYALEMNQGWFQKNGIRVGDIVRIPSILK